MSQDTKQPVTLVDFQIQGDVSVSPATHEQNTRFRLVVHHGEQDHTIEGAATGTECLKLKLFEALYGFFVERVLRNLLSFQLGNVSISFPTFERPLNGVTCTVQLYHRTQSKRPGQASGASELEAFLRALIEALNNAVPNGVR